MVLYTAKYKLPGDLFWTKVKNLKGDHLENGKQILILADERQIHLPVNAVVMFDRNRFLSIKEAMEAEVGRTLNVAGGA